MKKISIYGHRSTHLCIGLFCFLFFISTPFWGQEQQYRFEYIGLEQGLPQEQVLKIIEDKEGFLWFGTMEGLVKYNGYDFTLFQPIHGDSTSLSSPIVDQILEDQEGFVWVGTHNGLNCYDRSTDSFKRYLHDDGDENSLPGNYVTWLNQDSRGRLWVGTVAGIAIYRRASNNFKVLELRGRNESLNADTAIFVHLVQEDESGNFWASSSAGILKINPEDQTFERYFSPSPYGKLYKQKTPPDNIENKIVLFDGFNRPYYWDLDNKQLFPFLPSGSLSNIIFSYRQIDKDGNYWLGEKGKGLHYFNKETGQLISFQETTCNDYGLGDDDIYALHYDRFHNLWIGTFHGIYKVNTHSIKFPFFQQEAGQRKPENRVYRVYEDSKGGWWFSTYDNRLFYSENPGERAKEILLSSHPDSNILIGTFFTDADDVVWLGSHNYGEKQLGVFVYDLDRQQSERIDLGDTLNHIEVRFIDADQANEDILWLSTWKGLCRLNRKTLSRRWYLPMHSNTGLVTNCVFNSIQTKDKIWAQLNSFFNAKLGYFDKKKERFKLIDIAEKMPNGVNEILIRGMTQTPDGYIWLATGQGLGKIDPVQDTFALIRTGSPLIDNGIMGVAPDKKGNLWIKTIHHVSKYDPATDSLHHFNVIKDMQEFNANGASVGRDGRILFNGNNGIYAFYPERVKLDTVPPRVVLTDFRILNQSVDFGRAPELIKDIEIRHQDQVISFEFAALHFLAPGQNRYQYKMEGFQEGWFDIGTERKVTFTNLNPGRYTFQVRASNADGVWAKTPLSINLRVMPPWWQTWWALTLWGLLVFAIIYTIYRFQLERKLEQAENQRLKELDATKTRLYTNITHEFRTPLTLILGPVNRALDEFSAISRENLRMIQQNGQRLLDLINRLLDLRKLDAGAMKAEYRQGDIVPLIRYVIDSFQSRAEEKQIKLEWNSGIRKLVMDYDREKLIIILSNLISNAIKYTPTGGEVRVIWRIDKDSRLELQFEDTGRGIPESKLAKIFNPFYQIDASSTRGEAGTGIGLALVKELIELLEGGISVESRPGRGTTFTVWLPVKNNAQIETGEDRMEKTGFAKTKFEAILKDNSGYPGIIPTSDKPYVLIIEDHQDVAEFIASGLKNRYQTGFAVDGQAGVNMAFETVPDIIISDVMLPGKNGFELCRVLKQDERTSHIPIILLTAKVDDASRLEGLEQGADVYLEKPFQEKELHLRIEKLLELRKKLQKYYQNIGEEKELEVAGKLGALSLSASEKAFLEKINSLIEKNSSDSHFQVKDLAWETGMSQAQLYRKLMALTGNSAGQLMRARKLKKAKQLLEDSSLTISEIAYECGYSDPAHFSHSFAKTFGISPSGYRAE